MREIPTIITIITQIILYFIDYSTQQIKYKKEKIQKTKEEVGKNSSDGLREGKLLIQERFASAPDKEMNDRSLFSGHLDYWLRLRRICF